MTAPHDPDAIRPMPEPSPPPLPADPVTLDAVALARLRELDPDGRHDVVRRVLGAFEISLTRQLGELAAAREGEVAARLTSVAHTVKSSAASVGALRLAALCDDIERRLRDDAGAPASRHDVERLSAEGQAALAAVRAILRS
jgi:HPt (histidine-containing phosphotransfer) domain-containing protein